MSKTGIHVAFTPGGRGPLGPDFSMLRLALLLIGFTFYGSLGLSQGHCERVLGRLLFETPRAEQRDQARALWGIKSYLERLPDHLKGANQELLNRVRAKLQWFEHQLSLEDKGAIESEAWKSEKVAAHIGNTLATFSSENDHLLRDGLIEFTGSLPPALAIDTLWGTVRGVGSLNRGEVKWANEKIMAIQWHNQSFFPNLYLSSENIELAERLGLNIEERFKSKVVGVDRMSNGGVSETYILRFENGERAIFKPAFGEPSYNHPNASFNKIGFSREANAFFFYHKYFKRDGIHIPMTVEAALHFGGRHYGVGSLQEFVEGYETVTKKYSPWGYQFNWQNLGPLWEKQREDARWKELAPWIQTFDYIIGNVDRFPHAKAPTGNPNNLLVKDDWGKLRVALIDNAKGRGYPISLDYIPRAKDIPWELREWIKSFNDGRFDEIRRDFKFQLPSDAIEDVIQRIRNVQNHIRYSGL